MISAALWNEWGGNDESRARFDRLHRSVGVRGRHLALPMEDYRALDSFSKMNDKWIERATELGRKRSNPRFARPVLNRPISITFSSLPLPVSPPRVSTPS
jgi:alkylresorcinol/alkylpyrone synthase